MPYDAAALRRVLACGLATVPWGLQRPIANLRTAGLAHVGVSALMLGQHQAASGEDAQGALRTGTRLLQMRLDHDRGDLETWQHLARASYLKGDIAGAERVLREGMDAVVRPQRLHVDLIRLLAESAQPAKAIDELGAYLPEHLNDAEMWHLQVYLLESSGRSDEALAAARAMNQQVPEDPRAWSNLGVALARRGELEASAGVLREGSRRFPGDRTIRENLARVERALR
jgi:Flp pilus assembly protein TadD